MSSMRFQDRVALVTGAARGLGKEIAYTLAREGASVAILSQHLERGTAVADEMVKEGFQARAYAANVAKYDEVEATVKQIIADFSKVDILVNSAGITRDNLAIRMSESDWDDVIDVNLKGTFNCSKACARFMARSRYGRVVNVSSVVGIMGNPGQANYAASKGGVIALTKSLAREFASRNITFNAVAPGYIPTDMTAHLTEEQTNRFMTNTPLGRFGTAADVAKVVAFLASDDSSFVTGQVINVDGGMLM